MERYFEAVYNTQAVSGSWTLIYRRSQEAWGHLGSWEWLCQLWNQRNPPVFPLAVGFHLLLCPLSHLTFCLRGSHCLSCCSVSPNRRDSIMDVICLPIPTPEPSPSTQMSGSARRLQWPAVLGRWVSLWSYWKLSDHQNHPGILEEYSCLNLIADTLNWNFSGECQRCPWLTIFISLCFDASYKARTSSFDTHQCLSLSLVVVRGMTRFSWPWEYDPPTVTKQKNALENCLPEMGTRGSRKLFNLAVTWRGRDGPTEGIDRWADISWSPAWETKCWGINLGFGGV